MLNFKFTLFFFIAISVHAETYPSISRFSQILSPDQPETVILLDLDETVMKPSGFLGTEEWYQKLVDKTDSHPLAMKQWNSVQNKIKMIPLDPTVSAWINLRKKPGISVFGFTARRPEIASETLRQLDDLNIHFTDPWPKGLIFEGFDAGRVKWNHGILFGNEFYTKGEILSGWIKKFSPSFRKIIFVDNYIQNLDSVKEVLQKNNVNYELYHFTNTNPCMGLLKLITH